MSEIFNLCEPRGDKVSVLKILMRGNVFQPTRRPPSVKKNGTALAMEVEEIYNHLSVTFRAHAPLGDRELDVFLVVMNAYDSNRDKWKNQKSEFRYIDIKIDTLIDAIRHPKPTEIRAREAAIEVLEKVMSLSMSIKEYNKHKGYLNLFSKAVPSEETVRVGAYFGYLADTFNKDKVHLDFGSTRERRNYIMNTFPDLEDPTAKQLAYRLQSHKRVMGKEDVYPEMLPYEKTMDGMGLTKRQTRRKTAIEKFKLIDKWTDIPLYKPAKVTTSRGRTETAWVNTKAEKMQRFLK